MRPEMQERGRKPSLSLCALSVLFVAVLWILFVGGIRRNEMFVGAVVLLLACTFTYRIWRIETLRTEFHLADISQGWRIPWYVLSGLYEIIAILLKDLLGVKKADSFYRMSGFKTSKSNPSLVARRILAIFYTTMAPNFIVIGIDFHQSRMLFHQLRRSSVPKMTKSLGAQPGAGRP